MGETAFYSWNGDGNGFLCTHLEIAGDCRGMEIFMIEFGLSLLSSIG